MSTQAYLNPDAYLAAGAARLAELERISPGLDDASNPEPEKEDAEYWLRISSRYLPPVPAPLPRYFYGQRERERQMIAGAEAEAIQRRALNRWEEPVWASWLIVGGRLA